MNDFINRNDLIEREELLKKPIYRFQTGFGITPEFDKFIKVSDILKMPSISKVPNALFFNSKIQGYWIEKTVEIDATIKNGIVTREYAHTARCSICNKEFAIADGYLEFFNFCPNCGAKMGRRVDSGGGYEMSNNTIPNSFAGL